MRSKSGEELWLKQEEISVSRSLFVLVPCIAQQTAGQAQQAWHGGREAALEFSWQRSMKAQPQGIITDVAEIQPSRGKVGEPARLAGCIGLLCRQVIVQAKTGEVLGSTGRIWGSRTGQGKRFGGSTEGRAGLGYSKQQSVGWGSCPFDCTLKRGLGVHFPHFS